MIAARVSTAALHACLAALLPLLLSTACNTGTAPPPTITSQGFDIGETREVRAGELEQMRLRIEAAGGVEELRIRERSYDVNLARTPEASHFALFGLDRRVWSKTDVTLDFGPYVATKLDSPGDYSISIEVTDREQQTTEATLRVVVLPTEADEAEEAESVEEAAEPTPAPGERTPAAESALEGAGTMRTREFRLERVGAGPVVAGDAFGITWRTIDSVYVVIRLSDGDGVESRFARLDPSAFQGIDTHEQLAEMVDEVGTRPSLDIATANAAAAGTVFAIVQPEQSYLLLAEASETSLSELGTTVTLKGRYKN